MRRSIRTRGLPDATHQDRIYEFVLREDLHLEIPGEHRGPEIVVAYHPEQERWVDGWRARGLTPAWDCLWAFRDRAALEAFEAELLAVEAASSPASAAPPATVSAASPATVSAASQATAPAAPAGPPQLPAPAWDVDESWGRIEAWLAREWSEVLADLRPGASARDLASLERGLELPLSPDLRRSLERHDGQHGRAPGVIGNYQLLSVAEILRQRDAWQRLAAGGGFAAFVARPDPGVQATWWSGAWVPLTWDGMGGHHCVDLAPGPGGSMGQVLEVRPREPERRLRARSVREWLAGIAHALEVGRFRVIEVRGAREFDEYGFGP